MKLILTLFLVLTSSQILANADKVNSQRCSFNQAEGKQELSIHGIVIRECFNNPQRVESYETTLGVSCSRYHVIGQRKAADESYIVTECLNKKNLGETYYKDAYLGKCAKGYSASNYFIWSEFDYPAVACTRNLL